MEDRINRWFYSVDIRLRRALHDSSKDVVDVPIAVMGCALGVTIFGAIAFHRRSKVLSKAVMETAFPQPEAAPPLRTPMALEVLTRREIAKLFLLPFAVISTSSGVALFGASKYMGVTSTDDFVEQVRWIRGYGVPPKECN
eukprot:GEMP01068094.1.p1 GENE.GEMP01068094.1~~GEMP01068094.1.p1  ORF type:complete len:141 (+),score=26.19 GEMP01068094.1:51-473(+)